MTPTILSISASPRHGLDRHVDDAATGDVIDQDRNADRIGDRLEMLIEPFLGRFVVIGCHDQKTVGTDLLGMARQQQRLVGAVGPRPRHHRHPAGRSLDAQLGHAHVLGVAESGGFTSRAARHQTIGALLNLPLNERLIGVLVDPAVGKRRDRRNERPPELDLAHYSLCSCSAVTSARLRA